MSVPWKNALAVVLVLAASATCVYLGLWQLDRHAQRAAYNAAMELALAADAVELDEALAERLVRAPHEGLYKRVHVRGEYVEGGELVWRGRSRTGAPGVNVIAPIVLEGTPVVLLVDRGWVPAPDGARVDPGPLRARGPARLEGLLQPFPTGDVNGLPLWTAEAGDSILTLGRLDRAFLRERFEGPLFTLYLQQLGGPADQGPPYPAEPPVLSAGPHLGYAVQWFGFAAVFVAGLLVVAVRRH
jgi:surfeit locus 1 family protein